VSDGTEIPPHLAPALAALEAVRGELLARYVRAVQEERLPNDAVLRVMAYAVGEIGGVAAQPASRELCLRLLEEGVRDGFHARVLAHDAPAGTS